MEFLFVLIFLPSLCNFYKLLPILIEYEKQERTIQVIEKVRFNLLVESIARFLHYSYHLFALLLNLFNCLNCLRFLTNFNLFYYFLLIILCQVVLIRGKNDWFVKQIYNWPFSSSNSLFLIFHSLQHLMRVNIEVFRVESLESPKYSFIYTYLNVSFHLFIHWIILLPKPIYLHLRRCIFFLKFGLFLISLNISRSPLWVSYRWYRVIIWLDLLLLNVWLKNLFFFFINLTSAVILCCLAFLDSLRTLN